MENKKIKKLENEIVHAWTVLCFGSSVDEESKTFSLFNIIDNMKTDIVVSTAQQKEKEIKGWYAIPLNLWLITNLQKPDIDLDLQLELRYQTLGPKGEKIGTSFGPTLKLGKGTDNIRIRNHIGTFPITEGGIYRITVSIGEVGGEKLIQVGEVRCKIDVNVKQS